jgi:hypothetical protein
MRRGIAAYQVLRVVLPTLAVTLAFGGMLIVRRAVESRMIDRRGPERRCEVHGRVLREDSVPICYGLIVKLERFRKAQRQLFPNARTFLLGGCVVGRTSPKRARVRYCSACRAAQDHYCAPAPEIRYLEGERLRAELRGDPGATSWLREPGEGATRPRFTKGCRQGGGCDLGVQGGRLTDADLRKIAWALTGARKCSAILDGVDLSGAHLDGIRLNGTRYYPNTRWPRGFDPQAAGARLVE